jgi:TRAP-type C4-dicarboxylate transport system permease small subunit
MDRFDRKIIVAVSLICFYMLFGTVFFHYTEGWRYVDSFYYSGTTLTTVGYGDFAPTHDFTKIMAVIFMFSGVGIVFYSISIIGQKYFEREEERLQKLWESTQQTREEMARHGVQPIRRVTKRIKREGEEFLAKIPGMEKPKE